MKAYGRLCDPIFIFHYDIGTAGSYLVLVSRNCYNYQRSSNLNEILSAAVEDLVNCAELVGEKIK